MKIHTLVASVALRTFDGVPAPGAARSMRVQVHTERGASGHGEAVPHGEVTAESIHGALAFVETHRPHWHSTITDVHSLRDWVEAHAREIDRNPCAWTAVEMALLDAMGNEAHRSLEALLGLAPLADAIPMTAVIGDGTPQRFDWQLTRYICAGFLKFRVALRGEPETDQFRVDALQSGNIGPHQVHAGAHQLWSDASHAIAHLRGLDYPFWGIEEPLFPAVHPDLAQLGKALDTRIILDHSFTRIEQMTLCAQRPEQWVFNVRVSKLGGIFRALKIVARARELGVPLILGTHVREVPLLNRVALALAAPAGDALLGNEGLFTEARPGQPREDEPIRWLTGGLIDASALAHRPGHGLDPSHHEPSGSRLFHR